MSLSIPEKIQSDTTALIDADVLVYRCGWASLTNIYDLFDSEGNYLNSFDGKTLMDEWIDYYSYDYEGCVYDVHPDWDTLENTLHTVKRTIESILESTNASKHELFLTGKGNFREDVAVSQVYKGTRTTEKPLYYQQIRDYLQHVWNAKVVKGIEADDELAIKHGEVENSVICTVDKDLHQVSGFHFDFSKPESGVFYIDIYSGLLNFYSQLITGDRIDNIPGLPGYGKKAAEVLQSCRNEYEMYSYVVSLYDENNFSRDYFHEQASLLWMLRDREDSWARQSARIEKGLKQMSDLQERVKQ